MNRFAQGLGALGLGFALALALGVATDGYPLKAPALTDPARDAWSVDGDGITSSSLSDTVDQAVLCKAFDADVAGNIKLTTMDGTTMVKPVQAGQTVSLRVKRFWSTGTTATGITAYKN